MYVARPILDFIAALAWPTIVAIALWRLWPALRSLAPRVSRVEGLGAMIEFEKLETESLLRRAVDDENKDDEGESATERSGEHSTSEAGGASALPAQGDAVSMTRDDLERIVKQFARTGWTMGRSGEFSSTPEPTIAWSSDGVPSITTWQGDRSARRPDRDVTAYMHAAQRMVDDRRARAREIEQQIVDLKVEAQRSSLASLARGGGAYAKINVLRSALKEVDPDSPFLRD